MHKLRFITWFLEAISLCTRNLPWVVALAFLSTSLKFNSIALYFVDRLIPDLNIFSWSGTPGSATYYISRVLHIAFDAPVYLPTFQSNHPDVHIQPAVLFCFQLCSALLLNALAIVLLITLYENLKHNVSPTQIINTLTRNPKVLLHLLAIFLIVNACKSQFLLAWTIPPITSLEQIETMSGFLFFTGIKLITLIIPACAAMLIWFAPLVYWQKKGTILDSLWGAFVVQKGHTIQLCLFIILLLFTKQAIGILIFEVITPPLEAVYGIDYQQTLVWMVTTLFLSIVTEGIWITLTLATCAVAYRDIELNEPITTA